MIENVDQDLGTMIALSEAEAERIDQIEEKRDLTQEMIRRIKTLGGAIGHNRRTDLLHRGKKHLRFLLLLLKLRQ
jgi:hypothetical protein